MNEFVASNGISVRAEVGAYALRIGGLGLLGGLGLRGGEVDALREFFLAERDAELGRWRSKEHPGYVVYKLTNSLIRVTNEATGEAVTFSQKVATGASASHSVAREFFAAHPEQKPWHDAKPGEVWLVTLDGKPSVPVTLEIDTDGEPAFFYGADAWDVSSASITAGRRIWPEEQGVVL